MTTTFADPYLIENLSLIELAKQKPRSARKKLQDDIIGRTCVCGEYVQWDEKPEGETDAHCHNKTCVWWNICTIEHSTPYTRLDQLYKLAYDRGICECRKPKLHEINGELVKDYCLCVNDGCFKVLRELETVVVDLRLYQ